MKRFVCIHGHFYQPPRENPWLEEVEIQDAAYPYHDWNERITDECYAPNTASRILDGEKRIVDIANNFSKISFNFGPTLLSWMEEKKPDVYDAILEADRTSRRTFSGHGSAIAQPYNHMIMPLASTRDKRTQVRWGIRDFTHRFGRKPEGMWLPETAVDLETLDIMAGEGITFSILAPHQARRVRKLDEKKWVDVDGSRIDPKLPYRCSLPSGKSMTLFFYDGPISRDVAFGDLLSSGEHFAGRLGGAFVAGNDSPQIVHIAADGETYGHHQRYGDMALAYCLYHIATSGLANITIFGEFLEKHPPAHEVEIHENTSWSCAHGIKRWISDCGCSSGMHPGWNQQWRGPLREAFDWLRDTLVPLYEGKAERLLKDPWAARDAYIEVINDRSEENVERFFAGHLKGAVSREDRVHLLKILEMQRHAMLMYTSCGWFFDDISGIEAVQVLQYAFRALQLAKEVSGADHQPSFLEILERAPSNIPKFKDGANVVESLVKPAVADLIRVGAHYAVSSVFEDYPEDLRICCFRNRSEAYDFQEAGRMKLVMGKSRVFSEITWEEAMFSFAVVHLGDHNLFGGVNPSPGDEAFAYMKREIREAFSRSDVPALLRLIEKHFGAEHYSLWHLFKDEQQKVLDLLLASTLEDVEVSFRQIYEFRYPILQVMKDLHIPVPKALSTPVEYILNLDLRRVIESAEIDADRLRKLVDEVKRWNFELDKTILSFVTNRRIHALMEELLQSPQDTAHLGKLDEILEILGGLELELDLWESQNIYFSIGKRIFKKMAAGSDSGDEAAAEWVEHFRSLGRHFGVRVE